MTDPHGRMALGLLIFTVGVVTFGMLAAFNP
jgi:hypothetical protein